MNVHPTDPFFTIRSGEQGEVLTALRLDPNDPERVLFQASNPDDGDLPLVAVPTEEVGEILGGAMAQLGLLALTQGQEV